MTRILFCDDSRAFTVLESASPAEELAAAINAGRCRLAFPPGNGPWWATLQGDLVVVTPGYAPLPPAAAGGLIPRMTHRQRQVLAMLAGGKTQKEIAVWLGIDARTVSNHVQRLNRKFEVSTSQQLVGRAVGLGVISG
jgi:DNA-binding CsgD family transcriptional regulator